MIPIPLCPQSHLGYSMTSEHLADENGDALRACANDCSWEAIRRRAAQIIAYDNPIPTSEADTDPFIQSLKSRWPLLSHVPGSKISSFDHPFPAKLLPLDQCILDIFWEAFDCPLSHSVIGSAGDLIMLRTAAMYQAKSETVSYLLHFQLRLTAEQDQLIAQSLICLRSCLEALRVKNSGHLEENLHQVCEPLSCKVDCIANITLSLELYVHELTRVFFKKENMRNKSWWLSVFYSFCIQSIVKHALIRLIGDAGPATQPTLGATLHLHLAVRLFIASSGSHDPLMRNYSIDSEPQSEGEAIRIKDYEQAQYASYKDQWPYFGIKSTKDFLERLFDI
jgi:hypothetical protein